MAPERRTGLVGDVVAAHDADLLARQLEVLLRGAAHLPCVDQPQHARPLERVDVVVEPGGRLSELGGHLHGRATSLGERLEETEPQRVSERAQLLRDAAAPCRGGAGRGGARGGGACRGGPRCA